MPRFKPVKTCVWDMIGHDIVSRQQYPTRYSCSIVNLTTPLKAFYFILYHRKQSLHIRSNTVRCMFVVYVAVCLFALSVMFMFHPPIHFSPSIVDSFCFVSFHCNVPCCIGLFSLPHLFIFSHIHIDTLTSSHHHSYYCTCRYSDVGSVCFFQ